MLPAKIPVVGDLHPAPPGTAGTEITPVSLLEEYLFHLLAWLIYPICWKQICTNCSRQYNSDNMTATNFVINARG